MERQQAIEIVDAILSYQKFFKDWQERERPVASRFVDALPERTPATILDALYSQYARQHHAVRWGDKSPIYTDYINEIAQIFPSAQFIHIIRDGRDVALSMLKAYTGRRFFYMNLCFAARTWKRRVLKACVSGAQLGVERYYA